MHPIKRLKKYLHTYLPFTRAGIQAAMVFRTNFIAWFVGDIVYCLVMYYIWLAVFNASGEGMMNGFTMTDMTVFLFITAMTRFLTDSDGSYDVGEEVKDGNIAMRLIKPVSFHSTFLFTEIGWKRNYSVPLRNPQFQDKVEKWKGTEKNQRNVNIQEAKKVVC